MSAYPPEPSPPSGAPQAGRARAALVLAIVVVAISLAGTVFSYLAPAILNSFALPISSFPLLFLPFQLTEIVLAIVALVLGIGPLRGAGPRGVAGIAVGISGAWLLSTGFSLVVGPLLSTLL